MTFVLNVLHKDFSLLAADRRGNAAGPLTITSGTLTFTAPPGTVIEGVRKIRVTSDGGRAVGFAGETAAHPYLPSFSDVTTNDEALRCIRTWVETYFDFGAREKLLRGEPRMENSAILSFFDSQSSAFFASLHVFTQFSNATELYARKANTRPMLLHVGSGSGHFEKTVGLDEINSFIDRLAAGTTLEERLAWLDDTFLKVSNLDKGCGATYDAVVATRENPLFAKIR